MNEKRLNIRVYGVLLNDLGDVLLSSENRKGFSFTKFPGGGLEWGEGTVDCLQREWKEELGLEINIKEHFYTTDYFQKSAFREADQLVSIYYLLRNEGVIKKIENMQTALDVEKGNTHFFHWEKLSNLKAEKLTFPIDQLVLEKLKKQFA